MKQRKHRVRMTLNKNNSFQNNQWGSWKDSDNKKKLESENVEWGTNQNFKGKQTAYNVYPQTWTDGSWELFKEKLNRAKHIIRRSYNHSWEKFISNIKGDIHMRQNISYKLMKHMNKSERDVAAIHKQM